MDGKDAPFQTAPLGLLGALGLKITGRNPDGFGLSLQPEYDATEHYLVGVQHVVKYDATIPAGFQTGVGVLTVPDGEVWRVLMLGAWWELNALDASIDTTATLFVTEAGGAGVPLSTSSFTANVALYRGLGTFPTPFLLPSGWTISVIGQLLTAPAGDALLRLSAIVQRIPV